MNFYIFKSKRIGTLLRVLLLALMLAAGYFAAASAKYVKIVDGDSLEIGGNRIRLVEIDAPEYKQYCFNKKREKYDCGIKAKQYLYDMIKEAEFKVVCHSKGTDRYNRQLAECFAGGKNLNLEMIKAGQAVAYRSDNAAYLQAESDAKQHKKGLWQGKFLRPEYYRRLNRR